MYNNIYNNNNFKWFMNKKLLIKFKFSYFNDNFDIEFYYEFFINYQYQKRKKKFLPYISCHSIV